MAKTINALTMGLSGNIPGLGLTFRRGRDGSIHAMTTPLPSTKPATAAQEATREQFREAAAAGREAVKDPATKAYYAQFVDDVTASAYAAAMQDRLMPPTIKQVNVDDYTGQIGTPIRVTAFDNHGVTRVSVHIHNLDGSLVEEGDATQQAGTLQWVYTARVRNASLTDDLISVQAFDRAGNNVTFSQALA
ncbi:MAG: hypothetical protein H7330_11045 [Hymenobacteraceae bacterium]|nr:hypothetical protein [Hymenobacteraceae bacterium]